MMLSDVQKKISEGFNAPPQYFYPAPITDRMNSVYDGSMHIQKDNYAIHWYGGYAPSQEFNRKYTEEFAKTSNDTISKWLREENLL
jgi:hypothetical protein